MRLVKMKLKMKGMKNSYISLLLLAVLAMATISYMEPRFQGFAVQDGVFNLEVDIPSSYDVVEPGSEIHFTTKIFNLAGEDRMDVSLRYEVTDEDGEMIISKSETMAIETQASFVGSLKIPDDAAEGSYVLCVTLLVHDVEEAKGENSFQVVKEENKVVYYTYVVIISIVSLVLLVYLASKSKGILEKFRMRSRIHNMVKKKLKN